MYKKKTGVAYTHCKDMQSIGTLRAENSKGLFDYDYEIVCKSFHLKDNISHAQYETWFSSKCINVFNKTLCGNGGTTGFINYALDHCKGLLILVPNVSICKSKEAEYQDNSEVCCVYGGSGKITKNAKVVIATYDQFHKLMNGGVNDYGIDYKEDWTSSIWTGRTILIDEYHKITDECSFRGVCFDVTKLIKEHNNGVVLMSATPHWGYVNFLKEYIPEREVKTYTVKYENEDGLLLEMDKPRWIQIYDVRKKLADILLKMYRSPKNKQIVVFYNNREDVKKLVQKMQIEDVEVLCSQEHSDDFGNYYSDVFCEDKRLHFLTSAYFTGCDIKVNIDTCVIIGSKSHSFLSYSSRDIKQMIGRFRAKCSGAVHLFYNGRVQDVYDYNENKTQYDLCMKYLEDIEENWSADDEAVRIRQQCLMLKDRLDNAEHWKDIKALKKMLADYGYIVKDGKIGEFESNICPIKKLSSKDTKKRIIEGVNVDWMENAMGGQYKAYLDKFGADALMKASQSDVKNWYKIRKNVGDEEDRLSLMLPSELYDAIGLEEGYYSGSYLMACLKYIGVKCSFDELSVKFMENFGAYACVISKDTNHKREKWLVIKYISPKIDGDSLYNDSSSKNGEMYSRTYISLNHKRDTQNRCKAKTFWLDSMTFQSLKGNGLYDWVMVDKKHRLPIVKANASQKKQWDNIKNYKQSKISEMFKYTNDEYGHTIKEMEYINCLICDIDSGLSFSEFKDRYKNYKWTAYPTLNNIDDDWKKFRVIVPLDQMVELKGEHNLKVLKVLRTNFCPYEDQNHQMPSYINQEDWEHRIENNGELWHIEQSFADNLALRIKNFKDFMSIAFSKADKFSSTGNISTLTIDEAKENFENSFKSADGARHTALFIIKNRLSADDRNAFENWLISTHPSYLANWRSHKVIRG